ncbi:MAG: aldehyde dehydrogenase family protein, partial [Desulfomonilia bacterium]
MSVSDVREIALKAKKASRAIMNLPSQVKARVLQDMADSLREHAAFLKQENQKDLENAQSNTLTQAMIDRLTLSDAVIEGMAVALEEIASLPDPVGKIAGMTRRPNGLVVGKMRIPIGVVGIIYESRPNVTADAAGLCLKSGNAVILRGGTEAFHSNHAITGILRGALEQSKIDPNAVSLIPVTDRNAVLEMLTLEDCIDLIIPRGGEGLIRT